MQIISDTSCLIHLHKVDLLNVSLLLPYPLSVPLPLLDDELLSFTQQEKA